MKVMVVGSGGREHALIWKLKQSSRVSQIFAAPGSAGISESARIVPVNEMDLDGLLRQAVKLSVDLVLVGPEDPLAAGLADRLRSKGISVLGPNADGAVLEASKSWAKRLMVEAGIPTAEFEVFSDFSEARKYCEAAIYPLVVKADGLAKGKGVTVCKDKNEALEALDRLMVKRVYGAAGDTVVIEDCLIGQEISYMFFTDGESVDVMPLSQDHKPVGNGDKGPNTGGMGAYYPVATADEDFQRRAVTEIAIPLVRALRDRGIDFKGVVCGGVMATEDGPKAFEFNARFGDPQAELLIPMMKDDLVDVAENILAGKLAANRPQWSCRPAMTVVLASKGYPVSTVVGDSISGLQNDSPDTITFHSATRLVDGEYITNGGRVLVIRGEGDSLAEASVAAYRRVEQIRFSGMNYRSDIGWRTLQAET